MEVKVTKCENGHYYDVNKYSTCPHCGAGEFTVAEPQKKRFSLFKKGTTAPARTSPVSMQFSKEIAKTSDELQFEDVETAGVYMPGQLQVEDVKTQGVFVDSEEDETVTNRAYLTENPDAVGNDDMTTGFFAETPAFEKQAETMSEKNKAGDKDDGKTTGFFVAAENIREQTTSLQEQIKAVTDDNDVKTTGYFAVKTAPTEEKRNMANFQVQPLVGWLVCIAGKHIGEDYRIIAGKNSIGRTEDNAVCLSEETSVSREKHAWIIFEPKKQDFYIKPGDGNGLVYLNDESVFDTTLLHNGDILELGDVKMIFISLCGQNFNWSYYINKE